MKLLASLSVVLSITFLACNSSESNSSESNDIPTDATEVVQEIEHSADFLSVEKWDSLSGETKNYYILNYAGVETRGAAISMVDSLKSDYPNAGYLWIPDFASLSGKELYAVFLDQTSYDFVAMESLNKVRENVKGSYLVKVNQSEERWSAYSPIDIRINDEKQKMILIYATPEDEEAYYNEGGEDWGWFVNDVSSYFHDHHPEIAFATVYGSGLFPSEIKKIEDELALEGGGFGYIFMDGKRKGWAGHDMPESVISQACEFFGFEMQEMSY